MSEVMSVRDVLALVEPVFAGMLSPRESRSLVVEVVPMDDRDGLRYDDDDLFACNDAVLAWRILGERGWSRGLSIDEGPVALVRGVQSDLQDFIAESRFGWGELRGPRDLP